MRKNVLITVFLTIITSVIVFIAGNYYTDRLHGGESSSIDFDESYSAIAGVIRNSGQGWDLVQDRGHETLGIKSVSEDDEKISIFYDDKSKVNALSATIDETMASEGYTVGASVGLNITYLYIYDKDQNLVTPSDYLNDKGNIWIQGIFKK